MTPPPPPPPSPPYIVLSSNIATWQQRFLRRLIVFTYDQALCYIRVERAHKPDKIGFGRAGSHSAAAKVALSQEAQHVPPHKERPQARWIAEDLVVRQHLRARLPLILAKDVNGNLGQQDYRYINPDVIEYWCNILHLLLASEQYQH